MCSYINYIKERYIVNGAKDEFLFYPCRGYDITIDNRFSRIKVRGPECQFWAFEL